MTRVNKYMVYNPKKDKPVKYYTHVEEAISDAIRLNNQENTDILVLQVVANIENKKIKVQNSKFIFEHRELEVIEE